MRSSSRLFVQLVRKPTSLRTYNRTHNKLQQPVQLPLYSLTLPVSVRASAPRRFFSTTPPPSSHPPSSHPYFSASQPPPQPTPQSSVFSSTDFLPKPGHIEPITSSNAPTSRKTLKDRFGFGKKTADLTILQYFFRTIFRLTCFSLIVGGTGFGIFVMFPRQLAQLIGKIRGMSDVHRFLDEEHMNDYFYPPKQDGNVIVTLPDLYRAYQTDVVKKIAHIFYELNYIEAHVDDINARLSERYKELLKIRAHNIDDLDLWLIPLHLTPTQYDNRQDIEIDNKYVAQIDLDVLHFLREQLPGSYWEATATNLNTTADERKQRLAMRDLMQTRHDIDHIIDILDLTSIISFETKRFTYQWVPEGEDELAEWKELQDAKKLAQQNIQNNGLAAWFKSLFPRTSLYAQKQDFIRNDDNKQRNLDIMTEEFPEKLDEQHSKTPNDRILEFTGKSSAPSEKFDQIDRQVEAEREIIAAKNQKRAQDASVKYKNLEERLVKRSSN